MDQQSFLRGPGNDVMHTTRLDHPLFGCAQNPLEKAYLQSGFTRAPQCVSVETLKFGVIRR